MNQEFYKTDMGIVIKDKDSIRVKSCYKKTVLSQEEFETSNPKKINKHKYLEELNRFFKNDKFSWEHNGVKFRKLENFECNEWGRIINYNDSKDIPMHDIGKEYIGLCMIVLYHGRLYYTFFSANYYPQMQLIDFHTKELTGKWTNIKNLAPIFNCETKTII